MKKIIGIDLGTTNSVVAISESGSVKIIPNTEGGNTTPSVVAYTKDGKQLVGVIAKRQAVTNPENTFFSIKRFIGGQYEENKNEIERMPYKAVKKNNGDVCVIAQGKEVSPQEISAAILSYLKKCAEDYLGQSVEQAVVTVPAYFNDAQRQATKDAGKIAGLDIVRIINEPTAAALAYGEDKKKNGIIAVFDFGGGTFDVSILEINDGVIEVKSTNGDTHLGGDDVDLAIINYLIEDFKQKEGINISKDKMALQRLKEAAEKAKIELSSLQETEINLPYLTADANGPKHFVVKLSRAKLESLCKDIFQRLLIPCKNALDDAKINKSEISEVILVGGSTRIPKVQELVKEFFGRDPNKSVNPDEAVAIGAAIQGAVLAGDSSHNVLLLDVTPLSLGIEVEGGIFAALITRNTTIPTKKSQVFSTAENNQTSVDIKIYQGEREIAKENKLLGEFRLSGIPAAPRGVPQVEVTFDLDANGIVHVSAKEKKTGTEQKITISNSSGLSKDEIDRMIKEAEEHKEEDKKLREIIEKKNRLEGIIIELEQTLEKHKDKLSAEDLQKTEEAIAAAKKAIVDHANDPQKLEEATKTLLEHSQKAAEILYQEEQKKQQAEQGNNQSSEKKDENDNGPIDTKTE